MRLITKGRINERHFIRALSLLELFVIDDPRYCRQVLRPIPTGQRKALARFCRKEMTSFSYSWGGREVVVIQVTRENNFVRRNVSAAAGLLAHELMHTLLRRRGLDRHIVDCYKRNYFSNFHLLSRLDFPRERLERLFREVGDEALLALKDIYANSEVLALGLGDHLLEYYYKRLGTMTYCPMPVFYERRTLLRKATFAAMLAALKFKISLLPIHVPFQRYGHPHAHRLIRHMERCYERNIREITSEFHDVEQLILDDFSPSCAFHKKYFDLVFMKVYKLLI